MVVHVVFGESVRVPMSPPPAAVHLHEWCLVWQLNLVLLQHMHACYGCQCVYGHGTHNHTHGIDIVVAGSPR
jgi:hypothetical protein